MATIVVALGGNALGYEVDDQIKNTKVAAKALVPFIKAGHSLVVCHGNGPQVGLINSAFETSNAKEKTPLIPFPECTAMSQGYIGYHLQNAFNEAVKNAGMLSVPVVSMITRTIVDENDRAFKNPTKPIGRYYTKKDADEMAKITGWTFKEDSGRGYRRVVASPKPVDIYESMSVRQLFYGREVVIAGGGGGIPVTKKGNKYIGQSAVVDKDFAAAKLAELVLADYFMILTAVDKVYINYNKKNQKGLDKVSCKMLEKYINQNQFAPGSMLPKIEASISFVKNRKNGNAVITSLSKVKAAFNGKSGTTITL